MEDASALNVSAHYMIKRDGTIYQLLPDTLFARHVIGLNHTAIGIENVGSKEQPLTDAQLRANSFLINRLKQRHDISYLIGHYEYPLFEGHPLWKERDESYRTDKIDPGKAFMDRLRENVRGLQLKGPPNSTSGRN
ncbi:MAG: peptidoglycan recognition family protein [Fodinibius sp.]|nr:peptidoglycan recognition family protein [Fodinibius sp.]